MPLLWGKFSSNFYTFTNLDNSILYIILKVDSSCKPVKMSASVSLLVFNSDKFVYFKSDTSNLGIWPLHGMTIGSTGSGWGNGRLQLHSAKQY